jgi:hypothetical protein
VKLKIAKGKEITKSPICSLKNLNSTPKPLKKTALLLSLVLILIGTAKAQENPTWQTPMHEIKFISGESEEAVLSIDPSLRYADLRQNERVFRLFYDNNSPIIKRARIVDQHSNLMVAKGRGSYFWGTARFEFIGGDIFRVKLNRNRNGYEIIGPNGRLFVVENFGISPVKTLTEKEFLAQAFYVFDRIKTTQRPPTEVILIASTTTLIH